MSKELFAFAKGSRIDESRLMLTKAFYFMLGSYTEQEAKKEDIWRDQSWWELLKHISHEIEELKRSKTQLKVIHNLQDLVGLSLILLAKVMEEKGYFERE